MASPTPAARTAANVRAELARAGYTPSRAASGLGWSNSRMARRLSGETAFDVTELSQVADFLGIPVETFLAASRGAA